MIPLSSPWLNSRINFDVPIHAILVDGSTYQYTTNPYTLVSFQEMSSLSGKGLRLMISLDLQHTVSRLLYEHEGILWRARLVRGRVGMKHLSVLRGVLHKSQVKPQDLIAEAD